LTRPPPAATAFRVVCLYGATALPYVEQAILDLRRAAARRRKEIAALTIESAVADRGRWDDVTRVYTLPFDVPTELPLELPVAISPLLRSLFPAAEFFNDLAVHEICWDKIATTERLLDRGVPMPATVITHDPDEARRFVLHHGHAILKDPRSCGGLSHLVMFAGEQGAIAGESGGRRYVVEFEAGGTGRSIDQGVLSCRPPFYLQRLVAAGGRGGVIKPAQIVRAYIVEGQAVMWTECYRSRIRRPSDFIVSVGLGARYRLLPSVGAAVRMLALRAAEVVGARAAVVDLVRTGDEGPYVLQVSTEGRHMIFDRSFKELPEFRAPFDFDEYLVQALFAEPGPPPRVLL